MGLITILVGYDALKNTRAQHERVEKGSEPKDKEFERVKKPHPGGAGRKGRA